MPFQSLLIYGCRPDDLADKCDFGFIQAVADELTFSLAYLDGDTNADDVVDLSDLNAVRNNFGGAGLGDSNFDGVVDLADLNEVRNNFGQRWSATNAPEPSSVVIMLIAITAGLATFRHKARQHLL